MLKQVVQSSARQAIKVKARLCILSALTVEALARHRALSSVLLLGFVFSIVAPTLAYWFHYVCLAAKIGLQAPL